MIINEFESAHLKHSPRVPVNVTKIAKIEKVVTLTCKYGTLAIFEYIAKSLLFFSGTIRYNKHRLSAIIKNIAISPRGG